MAGPRLAPGRDPRRPRQPDRPRAPRFLTDTVTIQRRFHGPPDSGQGGYSCGLLGARLGASAEVSLRLPPPLERPLEVVEREGGLELRDGEALVAAGRPATFELEARPAPAPEEAAAAAARYPWRDTHPFPTCFGCGPERPAPDGLSLLLGPVDGGELWATPWTPDPSLAGPDGSLPAELAWAALDCPTAAPLFEWLRGPAVLARLRTRLEGPIAAGEPHVVSAWALEHDGRKHLAACAIHGPDGGLRAVSDGLWVELRDPRTHGART